MPVQSRKSLSLVRNFSDFYQEVAAIKQAIADGTLPVYLADGRKTQTDIHSLVSMTSLRLYSFLVKQAQLVREQGNEQERKSYKVAQYAMAALADEIFIIKLKWDGNEAWQDYMLEERLFKTSMAGRNLFDHISKLLHSRSHSLLQQELGIIFQMVLQLGFKGLYIGKSGDIHLKAIRKDLLHYIGITANGDQPAFPQAAQEQYKLSKPFGAHLAPLSRWYWLGALCMVSYLAISSIFWISVSSKITELLPASLVSNIATSSQKSSASNIFESELENSQSNTTKILPVRLASQSIDTVTTLLSRCESLSQQCSTSKGILKTYCIQQLAKQCDAHSFP